MTNLLKSTCASLATILGVGVAGIALIAMPAPAHASPITYDLSGVIAYFENDFFSLTGSFVFDPAFPYTEYSADIVVSQSGCEGYLPPVCVPGSGSQYFGTYNDTAEFPITNDPNSPFAYMGVFSLTIVFDQPLADVTDDVSFVEFYAPIAEGGMWVGGPPAGEAIPEATTVTTPSGVPEPASLTLFGTALLGLLALRRWQSRTASKI
jgi:hypothetical protein